MSEDDSTEMAKTRKAIRDEVASVRANLEVLLARLEVTETRGKVELWQLTACLNNLKEATDTSRTASYFLCPSSRKVR